MILMSLASEEKHLQEWKMIHHHITTLLLETIQLSLSIASNSL